MAGSIAGGKKAAETNIRKYGKDFYRNIGYAGGKAIATKPKGFAAMPKEKVRAAGALGGTRSKRGKKVVRDEQAK